MNIKFVNGYAEEWEWAVPETFKKPLETGNIKEGYVFYNNRIAYDETWRTWLMSENPMSLQVQSVSEGQMKVKVTAPNKVRTLTLSICQLIELLSKGSL